VIAITNPGHHSVIMNACVLIFSKMITTFLEELPPIELKYPPGAPNLKWYLMGIYVAKL